MFEWILRVLIRAPLAMGVGLALEVLVTVFGTLLFRDSSLWHTLHGNTLINFLVFHVIGWIIVVKDWGFVAGDKIDVDPVYNNCYNGYATDGVRYTVVQDGKMVTGTIYTK